MQTSDDYRHNHSASVVYTCRSGMTAVMTIAADVVTL